MHSMQKCGPPEGSRIPSRLSSTSDCTSYTTCLGLLKKTNARPSFFGHITNNVSYDRLAPSLLPELKAAASKAEKRARLHQFLTEDIGHSALRAHLHSIATLLRIAKTPEEFFAMVDQAFPKFGTTGKLDFAEKY